MWRIAETKPQETFQQLQELIPDDVGVALLASYLAPGALDGLPLDGPLPELHASEGMQSRQQLVIEQSRRDGLSIREVARHFAGARGHWRIAGTAADVADQLESWFEGGAADGFNVMPAYFPGELDSFVDKVDSGITAARPLSHRLRGNHAAGQSRPRDQILSGLADRIVADIRTRAPFEPREEEIDGLENAYRVQAEVTAALLSERPDRHIAGYKIAFNKKSSMDYYGLSEPCYAPLFSDEVHSSGATLAVSAFRDLVIEPEIAVRLRSPLFGDADQAAVGGAIGGYLPAIELMDARGAFARDPSAAAAVAQRVHSRGAVIGAEICQ